MTYTNTILIGNTMLGLIAWSSACGPCPGAPPGTNCGVAPKPKPEQQVPLWVDQAAYDYPMASIVSSLPDGHCTSPDQVQISVKPVGDATDVCTCLTQWP